MEWVLLVFIGLVTWMIPASQICVPSVADLYIGERVEISKNHFKLGQSYLKKNEHGIWEMYIEGDAYERGLVYGELAQDLIRHQEDIFVEQINQFVPSGLFQQFLRLFVGYFNADIPDHVSEEYQQEIYGVSQFFSDEYNYIAPKYTRILNYHAAHDIGHALNDYSIVGCTSFAVKGKKSQTDDLLVARNFDFYVGDAFAVDKLLLFVKPDMGYSFVSYSWAGFMGVASGMNETGLTVSINAAKSDLPTGSKTPISLLAREILQYASTIDEAYEIARKRQTFVSESILIASAHEGKAVIIEKSPKHTRLYKKDGDELVCANHYQSDFFRKDNVNQKNIALSDSRYRFARVEELLRKKDSLSPLDAVTILRDQYAVGGDTLGMGNPRALNQMLAHHSFIAQPQQQIFFVSTAPWQMGLFAAYDLNESFKQKRAVEVATLPKDPFLESSAYGKFMNYRKIKERISEFLLFDEKLVLSAKEISTFIRSNGESYLTYELLGKYYHKKKQFAKAAEYFSEALKHQTASEQVRRELIKLKDACTKQAT